jgi:hypothetical protein
VTLDFVNEKETHKSASKHTKKQNKTIKSTTAHPKAQKSKKPQKPSTRIQTQRTAQKCRTEHRYWKKALPLIIQNFITGFV